MFPNVYFICMEHTLQYINERYLFQYPSKVVTELADTKIKIGFTKNEDKEILLFIADVNLVAKKFQKHEYHHNNHTKVPSKSDISRQIHQWKISHQA